MVHIIVVAELLPPPKKTLLCGTPQIGSGRHAIAILPTLLITSPSGEVRQRSDDDIITISEKMRCTHCLCGQSPSSLENQMMRPNEEKPTK